MEYRWRADSLFRRLPAAPALVRPGPVPSTGLDVLAVFGSGSVLFFGWMALSPQLACRA
ncbi:hypothetical protein NET03_04595 [Thermomicrobium sp. CFH 73360]|uniref:hypothetical protein n=1 Tax=Thermomicrobium sp. CFH 73360 TaxID=2951987 RepID=UPI002077769F|nr:hypothetical protein [Thermomicrobium sp. CFH 73360]MCM8745801.1 hypothetical protein [Thermomicrobium sp. CFH 73360]